MPTIIMESPDSRYDDETGVRYHFPKRYLKMLQPGTQVVYYKGKRKNGEKSIRLSKDPHYFGIGIVGRLAPNEQGLEGDYYCEIVAYQPFEKPVPIRQNGVPFEQIPPNKATNYWRDGVRAATQAVYDSIVAAADLSTSNESGVAETNDVEQGNESALTTVVFTEDGRGKRVYGTRYERNPKLRARAIEIHGTACQACNFNFEAVYGPHGKGFVHVHHCRPISETASITEVNAETDVNVLCANCHAMVHRYRDRLLTLAQLRALIQTGLPPR